MTAAIARRLQLLAFFAVAIALGLVLGGVLAWAPLVVLVLGCVAWTAGDRQIRGVIGASASRPPLN